jgi:hypothetical protein
VKICESLTPFDSNEFVDPLSQNIRFVNSAPISQCKPFPDEVRLSVIWVCEVV